jgi:hypothetical protein
LGFRQADFTASGNVANLASLDKSSWPKDSSREREEAGLKGMKRFLQWSGF